MNEKAKIIQRKKQGTQRLSVRLKCVKLVQNGKSASEVGRLHKQSPRAVSYWVTRFKLHGAEGLKDARVRSGRRSKLTPSQIKVLRFFLTRSQSKSKPVSGDALSKYIKEKFGVNLTIRQCRRILRRMTAQNTL